MRRSAQLLVTLACVVSVFIVLRATSRGIGLSPDSLQYFSASESVAHGDGLMTIGWEGERTPLTHFPPGYPLLLTAAIRIGWSPAQFARWFNVALLAVTIVLATVIARRVAPGSSWAAPTVAVMSAVAHDLVVAHSMAWTEPPYLTLSLGGVLSLGSALEKKSSWLLLLAAIAAGAAAVLRYVGVANIGVVGLAVLLWWPTSFWRRVRASSAASILAALPLLIVLAYSATASDAPVANRQLLWHPLGGADLWMAAAVVGKWVSPLSDATYLTAVWLTAVVGLVCILITEGVRERRAMRQQWAAERSYARVLLLYAAIYVVVLVLSMSLADAQTAFESRILVPLLPAAIILGVAWLARQNTRNSRVRFSTGALVSLVVLAGLSRIVPWMRAAYGHGLALRRMERSDEPLVQATRRLPASAHIVSDRAYFLRVQTARAVSGVPRERDPNTLLQNPRYALQVHAICDSAAVRPTFLVLFGHDESEDPTANAGAAARSGDVARVSGGEVIRVRPGCRSGPA
jgi:hypothetical protein